MNVHRFRVVLATLGSWVTSEIVSLGIIRRRHEGDLFYMNVVNRVIRASLGKKAVFSSIL